MLGLSCCGNRPGTCIRPGETGPTTGLGRDAIATRDMLWIPPRGRLVSVCVNMLSSL